MAITTAKIIEAIQEGTHAANKKYEEWSNGSWVTDSGVESLMVACIAESLNKHQEQYESLGMEVSFRDIKTMSKARSKSGSRPTMVKDANRADIVVFNRLVRPTCVIEVKRTWNTGQCWEDLERIRDLVRTCSHVKGGSLRRGFLALIIPKKATNTKVPDDRIKEYMGKIEELVNSELKIKGEDVKYHLGKAHPSGKSFRELYGNWKAASFCIELSSRNAPNN